MALNYDAISNRLRTFRFSHGGDMELLRKQRMQDVFDIEELGYIHKKATENHQNELIGTLFVQPLNYYLGRMQLFNKQHPYFRVFMRVALVVLPFYMLRQDSNEEMNQIYQDFLSKKVLSKYEAPITLKHDELNH